jgi:hypothetical protein
MRGIQARRASFWDIEVRLKPTLSVVGDEDDHCVTPGIFLKSLLPSSGFVIFPKSGHALNLEEPALFNQVLLLHLPGDVRELVTKGSACEPARNHSHPISLFTTPRGSQRC